MVNYETGEIVDLSSTFISEKVKAFLRNMLVGHNIHMESIDELLEDIDFLYHGAVKKAFCFCIKSNYEKYYEWRKDNNMNCGFD